MRAASLIPAGIVVATWTVVYGHELKVGEVNVPHSHLCEREPRHDIVVSHRRAFTPDQAAQVTSQARAAIASIAALGTRVIYSSPPDNGKNCHGVTFDGGRSWIDDPTPLLRDCRKIDRADVQAGDVVVYKDGGRIKHSGRVTRIDESGIWVHSQWGAWGDFDHLVDAVTQGEEFDWDWKPDEKAKGKSGRYGTPEFYRCP